MQGQKGYGKYRERTKALDNPHSSAGEPPSTIPKIGLFLGYFSDSKIGLLMGYFMGEIFAGTDQPTWQPCVKLPMFFLKEEVNRVNTGNWQPAELAMQTPQKDVYPWQQDLLPPKKKRREVTGQRVKDRDSRTLIRDISSLADSMTGRGTRRLETILPQPNERRPFSQAEIFKGEPNS